ncbi:MAG: hypothetical protein QXT45_05485, partial [Candidatus Bilamarchaeaceae archaeon]
PTTKQEIDDDTIKNIIAKAASRVELECNIDVFPVVRVVRAPWDRVKSGQGWGQINLGVRQIRTLLEVSVRTVDSMHVKNDVAYSDTDDSREGTVLFNIPLSWVDTSYLRKGVIHFIPLLSSSEGVIIGLPAVGYAANPMVHILRFQQQMPSFWFIRYESGFEENAIPSIINDLIGIYAAIDILSMLGPTNRFNSQSIGLDGASQGVSGPGNQLYALRIQELMQKAEMIKDVIKSRFTNKIFMRHI